MRRPPPALSLLALMVLAACSNPGPTERAGRSVDRAAERTGSALGGAARDTGAALDRAGNWVGNRVDPDRR
ncbi:hypothetical protein [Roseomonas xinghualingensis]|uniref:hypothetical protein n=1 Tax=Roseomonas xinghualingensis TaxID=2986475 RepID=UPI0021F1F153|nr:hypothetical protein [Roseomonas sp. SXEYE001]MCV4206615.1 hypothetical protein [Roseomonas sp. SXEYE001]